MAQDSGTATPTAASLTQAAIQHAPAAGAPLDASLLTKTFTTTPRPVPAPDSPEVRDCSVFTDHMITASWTEASGWTAPALVPHGPISLPPSASCLHYATTCFEGMKLYRGTDSRLRLFRPDRNAARLARSSARIALPPFPPSQLVALVAALCAVDGPKWLAPSRPGSFLYIRPTLIGTDASLGVKAPRSALLYILIGVWPDLSVPAPSPSGPADVHGLRLLASREDSIRAWPGGFGSAKLGANYGPSLLAQREAAARGFTQILWLLGKEGAALVTEAGASNFFVVWRAKDTGAIELVTAPLDDGVILQGVTRDSILRLARERLPDVEVVERQYSIGELAEAAREGRVVEAFAAGTAYFVAPVGLVEWRGEELRIPTEEGATGRYARLIKGWLGDIMYGREAHEWGVVVDETGVEA